MTETPVPETAAAFTKPIEPASLAQMSVEEVLATARRPERTARIYLRGDLLAEREELLAELALLVDARGQVLDADERGMGEESNASKAQRLAAQLDETDRVLAGSAWLVRFRGMHSDDWGAFVKAHMPKGEKPDVTDFNNLLIAATAIAPTLSVEQVQKMRTTLGASQITTLANTAWEACNAGGVDLPKSPSFLANLAQQ